MLVQAPDRLVVELAACKASDPECGIEKLHFYPFGGLARTADWANTLVAGAFAVDPRKAALHLGASDQARAAS
jgi:methylenetetrahydrofolate reductase (NADPH)